MEEKKETQRRVLELMKSDLHTGTAAAFEAYGGLVWSVCARQLDNTEDIRECVNDTFLHFSRCHQQFDPEKGSLSNYLCTIALRRATERYRKNLSVSLAEQGYRNRTRADISERDRADLELALAQLDPVDAGILRSKYYGGMTYQEIAASLGMPYDTVKKRGQRNLKRLRYILIGLILALLAAGCAYIIYRSFQFAEGAGPNFDPERPIYQLSSVAGEPYMLSKGSCFVKNAIYQDGQLYVRIGMASNGEWPPDTEENSDILFEMDREYQHFCSFLYTFNCYDADGNPLEALIGGNNSFYGRSGQGFMERIFHWTPEEPTPDTLTFRIEMLPQDVTEFGVKESYVDRGTITQADLDKLARSLPAWTITLEKPDFKEGSEESGTFYNYLDTGFLVQEGTAHSNGAYVSLYPYQAETEYPLDTMIMRNYAAVYDDRKITLTAPDGTQYPATIILGGSASPLMGREIFFPDAPPGDYTLTIPYLSVSKEDTSNSVSFPAPTELDQRVELDETAAFSDGSAIHITAVTYWKDSVKSVFPDEAGNLVEVFMDQWYYTVEYELEPQEDLILYSFACDNQFTLDGGGESLSGGYHAGDLSGSFILKFTHNYWTDLKYQEAAPYQVTLTFHTPTYVLDQQIRIPVTVCDPGR